MRERVMSVEERWRRKLELLKDEGRHRTLAPPLGIDFSSNDYLAYSLHNGTARLYEPEASATVSQKPSLTLPARKLSRSGAASRLLRGHHAIWDEVEATLADWHHAESALVMTSGYGANEGLLSAIVESGDTVFSDQFNHASIIDGLRLSRAEKVIFAHNDLNDLELQMKQRHATRMATQAWFIITESLFGMEGDRAPLRELADLAGRYDAHLIVDEAHATGCFGDHGSGLVDALGLRARVLASVHTGGKALAVPGAYIVGSRLLKDWLVNRCRHFIFTTALPPAIAAWWLDVYARVASDHGRRQSLHERTSGFRKALAACGIAVGGSEYIATITLGTDARAVAVAQALQAQDFDIRAIRPPTVPLGTARLRISIHADHEPTVLRNLADTLAAVLASSL
jgi:8-amino-7-oxononanoate synthase